MASLAELATANAAVERRDLASSASCRVVGPALRSCVADLLLCAPVDSDATSFVVLGHIRSSTGPTSHAGDPVGRIVASSARPMVQRCFIDGLRFESDGGAGFVEDPRHHRARGRSNSNWTRSVMVDHVPVRHEGEIIAVLTREGEAGLTRIHSGLETPVPRVVPAVRGDGRGGTFPSGGREAWRIPRASRR